MPEPGAALDETLQLAMVKRKAPPTMDPKVTMGAGTQEVGPKP
jgi:hypothetical protein